MVIRLVPWETRCWCLSYRELGSYFSNHSPVPGQVALVIFLGCSSHLPDGELVFNEAHQIKLPTMATLPVLVCPLSMIHLC